MAAATPPRCKTAPHATPMTTQPPKLEESSPLAAGDVAKLMADFRLSCQFEKVPDLHTFIARPSGGFQRSRAQILKALRMGNPKMCANHRCDLRGRGNRRSIPPAETGNSDKIQRGTPLDLSDQVKKMTSPRQLQSVVQRHFSNRIWPGNSPIDGLDRSDRISGSESPLENHLCTTFCSCLGLVSFQDAHFLRKEPNFPPLLLRPLAGYSAPARQF